MLGLIFSDILGHIF